MPTTRLWLISLVALGLGLRAYHYLRVPAVWIDEAALIVNVLDKDYASLLGPLHFHEAAPPLFLWLEKAVSTTLGDGPRAIEIIAVPGQLRRSLARGGRRTTATRPRGGAVGGPLFLLFGAAAVACL